MNNVTASIENNPFKDKTRQAIVEQSMILGKDISSISLPAEHWLFEKQLLAACPTAKIVGVEYDWNTYSKAKANIPANAQLLNGSIGIYVYPDNVSPDLNLAWLDYCGTPNGGVKHGLSRISEPAKLIRHFATTKREGLVYVTYCMTCRHMTIQEMAESLWKGLPLEGAIKRRLWDTIGIKSGKGVHLVFEVKYLGGRMQKTPMITLGFYVGKNPPPVFNADWTVEVKQARQAAHAAKYGGNYIPPEQLSKIQEIKTKSESEWNHYSTLLKHAKMQVEKYEKELEGNLIALTSKELIKTAHKQGLSTAAIHELTKQLPRGCSFNGSTFSRCVTRRNVGATVAWM